MKREVTPKLPCQFATVAFTPKGGCPLKLLTLCVLRIWLTSVAFTPKGGCPLKLGVLITEDEDGLAVAFTPKGGCPLKRYPCIPPSQPSARSIHPQGWVPIETTDPVFSRAGSVVLVAFTPKGGCPLKPGS